MTTIIELIKKTLRAADPTLDISGSSTLSDLLITPGSLMMEPFIKQLQFLLLNLGINDPQSMEPTELDAILGNFLKFRNPGTPSTGVVELFYTTPTSIDIPNGTLFTDTGGNTYATSKQYSISADAMAINSWLYPYYSTGPISVSSTKTGLITEIGPNQITTTDLKPAPAKVTNPAGFSGGTDGETNLDFVLRVMDEVTTGSLGSAVGIQTTLVSSFPTIKNISIKGMGDTEMLRDLVLSGINTFPYKTVVDFYGRVSGLYDLPYPESTAYWNVFWDDPTTSGIQPDLPSLSEIAVDEITTDQYAGIYSLDDAASLKFHTQVIAEERFADDTIPAHWRLSDAKHGLSVVASSFEFAVEQRGASNKFRLGYRTTEVDVPTRPIKVDVQFMLNVLNFLKIAATMAPEVSAAQPHANSYADVPAITTFATVS